MLIVALAFAIRLFFFPESVASQLPSAAPLPQVSDYLHYRGLYLITVTALYFYSYYWDWYFETIAFVIFELAILAMVRDFVNVYSHFTPDSVSGDLIFFSLLRFMATACLFLNTFNSHRAPPPPRRFRSAPGSFRSLGQFNSLR